MRSSYIENNYGSVFRALILAKQPKLVVECGVLDGYSTYNISDALRFNSLSRGISSKFYSYDLWEDYKHKHGNIIEMEFKILLVFNILPLITGILSCLVTMFYFRWSTRIKMKYKKEYEYLDCFTKFVSEINKLHSSHNICKCKNCMKNIMKNGIVYQRDLGLCGMTLSKYVYFYKNNKIKEISKYCYEIINSICDYGDRNVIPYGMIDEEINNINKLYRRF